MSATSELTFIAPKLTFSEPRISTLTTTAQLGVKIQLDELFASVAILPYWDLNDGVLKMEFKGQVKGTSFKDIMLKQKKEKKSFFNQATLVVRREVAPLSWKEINVKLFRNGGVQMTGVRSIPMSTETLRWLVPYLTKMCGAAIFDGEPRIHNEQVDLINTDFSIGAKVRRDNLHRILSETYRLNSSYESAIYQGVKTKYFYNAERPADVSPGICPCERLCKGSGDGTKIGECKKITIAPFQTGQVIITGASTMDQINEAYEFIKNVFTRHADDILRKEYILPTAADAPKEDKTVPAKPTRSGWILHPCPRNIMKFKEGKCVKS